jgi:nucleoside-diphosphate-sugar epimerase
MKAMVTGATGFVGSHLIDRLLAAGHEVTALVRSPAKAAGLEARRVRLVRGDLHAEAAIREAVRGQNVVYHVAALVAARNEAEFFRANREGTASIVRAMEQLAPYARLVHVSSLAAAGPAALGAPRTADQPEAPVTMYGRSKNAAEQVVRQSHLPWVIARPPAVYGPRDRDNFLQVFKLVRSGFAPVFGDGSQELSMVYAPDLARSLELVGTTPGIESRAYFTNHPEIVTTTDLVRRIGKLMGRDVRIIPIPKPAARALLGAVGSLAAALGNRTVLRADKAHDFFSPGWTGDPTQVMSETGWQPEHDLDRGLAATKAWYQEAGWLPR